MELHEREFFVARIDCGYTIYKGHGLLLRIYPPSKDIAYVAMQIYKDTYDKAMMDDVITSQYAFEIMKANGIWTETMSSDFDKLPKHIEDLKVGLYEAAYKTNERNKIREYLKLSKKEYGRLHDIRYGWDAYTVEGLASFAKYAYIFENSLTDVDGKKFDLSSSNISVTEIMSYFRGQTLSESQIREIARNDPWNVIWSCRKTNRAQIFSEPLTSEQQSLIMWSKTYDSINDSSECPNKEVLEDDDMLDGWLILNHRRREKEQHKSGFSKFTDNQKIANADEVFIQVDTIEDAKKIHQMNDPVSAAKKRRRFAQLDAKGEVQLQHFGDIQQQIKMQAVNELIGHIKNGGK